VKPFLELPRFTFPLTCPPTFFCFRASLFPRWGSCDFLFSLPPRHQSPSSCGFRSLFYVSVLCPPSLPVKPFHLLLKGCPAPAPSSFFFIHRRWGRLSTPFFQAVLLRTPFSPVPWGCCHLPERDRSTTCLLRPRTPTFPLTVLSFFLVKIPQFV